ncbi:MAG: hypothetical protein Q9160_006779 [Pyrenula sp. 1 TL-2023]
MRIDPSKSVVTVPMMESNYYQIYPDGTSSSIEDNVLSPSNAVWSTLNPFLFMNYPNPSSSSSPPTLSSSSLRSSSATPSQSNTNVPTRTPPQQAERDQLRKERRHKPQAKPQAQPLAVKRERNRRAASKCRSKALGRQQDLQERARLLERENTCLGTMVEGLKEEAYLYRSKLTTHHLDCSDIASAGSAQPQQRYADMPNIHHMGSSPTHGSAQPQMPDSHTHSVFDQL